MKFKKVEPVGYTDVPCFVDRTHGACEGEGCDDCHGGGLVGTMEVRPQPVYLNVKQRKRARWLRCEAGLGLRATADLFELSVVDWCQVELGGLEPESWGDLFEVLLRKGG